MGTVHKTQQICFYYLLHSFCRNILKPSAGHNAGIVYPDINSAVELQCLVGQAFYSGGVAHICLNPKCGYFQVMAKCHRFIQPFLAAGRDDDVTSFERKSFCGSTANATAATGNHYSFSA